MIEKNLIVIFIIINLWISKYLCAVCPRSEWIYPCECADNSISCDGSLFAQFDIKKIFKQISDNVMNEEDKHFDIFILDNFPHEEITDNIFYDITFRKIFIINARNLKRITARAFMGTSKILEEFHQIGKSKLGEDDFFVDEMFVTLSSFNNIKWIEFEETHIKRIPSNAFNIALNQLNILDFNPLNPINIIGSIRSIGERAFYRLKSLRFLGLSYQQLDYIQEKAFDFESKSNVSLVINLSDNNLNSSSFAKGSFLGAQRPLYIHLWNNRITFLDKDIFSPFLELDKRNTINLGGNNPLICDCTVHWLFKGRDKYKDQVKEATCINGNDIWHLNDSHFQNCFDK